MAAEAIKVRAQGAKLYKETGDSSIEGYKTMPLDELRTHIERIQKGKGKSPAKGKAASTNGAKGKAATAPAPAKGKVAQRDLSPQPGKTRGDGVGGARPAKGKSSATTPTPAKSTSQKSSPAKGKAATGTAKRSATAAVKGKATTVKGAAKAPAKGKSSVAPAKGKWQPGSRGRVPASATKAQIREHERMRREAAATRATAVKGKLPRSTPRGKTTTAKSRGKRGQVEGRAMIDNGSIDWKAESNVGLKGKRKDVMDALRRYKGDKSKVFDALKENAKSYYKGKTKHEAERMLVWLIGRVAFDFVLKTGQHEPGTRDSYGESESAINVRRREQRAAARKQRDREARASGKAPARGKPAAKAAAKPKPATRGKATAKPRGKQQSRTGKAASRVQKSQRRGNLARKGSK